MKNKIIKNILSKKSELFRINREYSSKSRTYGTKDQLYTQDVDLITILKEQKNLKLSEIGKIEKKTKSAISQIFVKLENKGFLKKTINIRDKRKKDFSLTEKGEKVYLYHCKIDKFINEEFKEMLDEYTEDDLKIFYTIFQRYIEKYEECFKKIEDIKDIKDIKKIVK